MSSYPFSSRVIWWSSTAITIKCFKANNDIVNAQILQHWGVFVQCNVAPTLIPSSPTSVASVDDAEAYIVHLAGGSNSEKFASTHEEEPTREGSDVTPTQGLFH